MKQSEEMLAACEALRRLIDEFDQLGMVVTAALASQAYHAAESERETTGNNQS